MDYRKRPRATRPVRVGTLTIGGGNGIVVQSMLTSDTLDTEKCVQETLELVAAGCQLVRLAAPTVRDAANLGAIRERLGALGCSVPLVADIHFKPEAAMEAVRWVEKVRINPGNFCDRKKFAVRVYTDAEYARELEKIEQTFRPLVLECLRRGVALRIGVNHGSLSDRITNRYGDTPAGMVESALEYARVARKWGLHELVFSMKASNPKVMLAAYRLLVRRLEEQGDDWNYPIHLGVTEAGDGIDGRIKSAIGIGGLLAEGIGDTIRVSLTEPSKEEIPVARALVELVERYRNQSPEGMVIPAGWEYERRSSRKLTLPDGISVGGDSPVRVAVTTRKEREQLIQDPALGELLPEFDLETVRPREVRLDQEESWKSLWNIREPCLVTIADRTPLPPLYAFRLLAARIPSWHPILLKDTFWPQEKGTWPDQLRTILDTSIQIGVLLCEGIGDAVLVRNEPDPKEAVLLAYHVLQGAGTRSFKTEFVACPSCGRTLFDLQQTTARIRAATGHLKGVKIAVMGCIVNGPGEMADADFGYVGGAPGKVNLYVGKTPVRFNIPEEEAVDRLIELIREKGKWVDP
ncbi:(E)-4-hydroxy-3-methylbut-2-enyl-diphosphate synthase [Candidatus Methylacidithermus pantelleriae]|uniref:(E)-4-hydroxy-3-methylbut-2-enyl-diphosphate synthase n=1 Tax=Candidatus Methylacidithermus pantelleriae TaxID=2744239 RepID=UPI001F013721|nr:(E)-4-hydroxy-3-methylbut-2-enyl-diphosphate synthase [Candidatus Methylacidithermus pantelleriae]